MRVTLLDYTGSGHDAWYAAHLMIFTKNTRIKMAPDGLREIAGWEPVKKFKELDYMANTIRSSWEFVDYTFLLEDVTRAFTHQLVRTRHASYAQQTMQILEIDASAVEPPRGLWYKEPKTEEDKEMRGIWDHAVSVVGNAYRSLIKRGATVEEARGLIPHNIRTNIVVKLNLRTLVEVLHSRISPRNLGEYRDVAILLKQAVLHVHPWARVFVEQTRDKVLADLDREIGYFAAVKGGDPLPRSEEVRERANRMLKLVDQVRRG